MPTSHLELADYRKRVFDIYRHVRESQDDPETGWRQFRTAQDRLFRFHPQTALDPEQVVNFSSLQYYPYNPALRFVLPVEPVEQKKVIKISLQEDGPTRLMAFGRIYFPVYDQTVSLTLFWIMGYGGGIFLPFKDLTNGTETYAGGRYLLDTIKGADLGRQGDQLVVDFNFAYNPSCAYNDRWSCPLPPAENSLPVPIQAGELRFD